MIASLLALITAFAAPADSAAVAAAEFSQDVEYRIEAILDEEADHLRGRAHLNYTNNAPAALDTLWLHQHLNAFRPNSAWAERELEFGERRFTDLSADEHGYERFTSVRIDGQEIAPVYPGAPDSTVVALPLPQSLGSGGSLTVEMDWEARPATEPRRQARRGRQYDFAQWYPRIAVYDEDGWQYHPLMPQGEFFGEFGTYEVTVDVADDQVVGATGVPVEGDPGWEAVAAEGYADAIDYRRGAYDAAAPEPLGLLEDDAGEGRKRIRWRAEEVIHFGWSTSPDFVYEGGVHNDVAFHVLYQSDAADEWGNGVALQRTYDALDFSEDLFGPYLYPQVTNLHRIESGGTEFPMLFMDGSASEGLIVHEMLHMWVHAMLANNEWRDGWIDEGLVTFATQWYWEEQGQSDVEVWGGRLETARELERARRTEPVAQPGADFGDFSTYVQMTYTKPALTFRMLRWMVGEEAVREMLRTLYEENALQHIHEEDIRAAAAEAMGEDLDWFWDQWLYTTDTLDYGVANASTRQMADGRWQTEITVLRLGRAWMPVDLQVGDEVQRLDSRDRRQVVRVTTAERPDEVVLDPDNMLLDLDPTNNRREVE